MLTDVLAKRKAQALEAIEKAIGTTNGEVNINLFVEHHLRELPDSYWQEKLGTKTPTPLAIVRLLQLRSSWGDDDIECFDFTLPDEVTNYVVSVRFDESGALDSISMES
jgi:hypothetical protein